MKLLKSSVPKRRMKVYARLVENEIQVQNQRNSDKVTYLLEFSQSFVWTLIDGQRSIQDIASIAKSHFPRLSYSEIKQFLTTLEQLKLIQIGK